MIRLAMKKYYNPFMKNTKNYLALGKLIRQFEELKSLEDYSAELYTSILPEITEATDKAAIRSIITDEHKHSKMAQAIIELLNQ